MHLSLQDGLTALMKASEAGHIDCVKVLLDKGADVNIQHKVSSAIIHCVYAMQNVSISPNSSGRHVHKNLSAYMYMLCCLVTESSTVAVELNITHRLCATIWRRCRKNYSTNETYLKSVN